MFPHEYQIRRKIVLHVTDCDIHTARSNEEGTEVLVIQPNKYMKSTLSRHDDPIQNSNIGLENSDQYVTSVDLSHMRSNVTNVSEEQLVTPSGTHDPVLPCANSPSESVPEVAAEKDISAAEKLDEDVGDCTLLPDVQISQASSLVSGSMTEQDSVSTDDQDVGQGHVSNVSDSMMVDTQPSSHGPASPVSSRGDGDAFDRPSSHGPASPVSSQGNGDAFGRLSSHGQASPVSSDRNRDAFDGLVDEVLNAVQPSTLWAGQQNSGMSPVESVESPDLEQFGSPPLLQPVTPPPTHVRSPMHLHNPLTTSTDYIHNLTSQCVSKVLDDKRQAYWQMPMNHWATEAGEAATASPNLKSIKDSDPDYEPEPEPESDSEEEVIYKKESFTMISVLMEKLKINGSNTGTTKNLTRTMTTLTNF